MGLRWLCALYWPRPSRSETAHRPNDTGDPCKVSGMGTNCPMVDNTDDPCNVYSVCVQKTISSADNVSLLTGRVFWTQVAPLSNQLFTTQLPASCCGEFCTSEDHQNVSWSLGSTLRVDFFFFLAGMLLRYWSYIMSLCRHFVSKISADSSLMSLRRLRRSRNWTVLSLKYLLKSEHSKNEHFL